MGGGGGRRRDEQREEGRTVADLRIRESRPGTKTRTKKRQFLSRLGVAIVLTASNEVEFHLRSLHAPLKLGARALREVGDGIKPIDVQGRKLLVGGVARALDEHEGYARHGGGVSVGEGGRVGRVSWWGRVAAATRELGDEVR